MPVHYDGLFTLPSLSPFAGFLAGNNVYYVGGKVLVQHVEENETIGLSHPMFHDLRSRGTGIAEYVVCSRTAGCYCRHSCAWLTLLFFSSTLPFI